ncbi:caspase family protein [Crocinitomix algicola]|uniref:caspase family protein n=1 Tax=Crocinitomix algicola TaxID=1740263 RepID=UPI0008331394|nr:caspase family protein [Crocinitomix algicola]
MKNVLLSLILLVSIFSIKGKNQPEVVLTTGHNDQINALAVTKDGQLLASASNDKQVKIWDLRTGKEFRTLPSTDGRVLQLAFSNDQKTLAGTSFNDELIVWDAIEGTEIFHAQAGNGKGIGFNKDGTVLFYFGPDNRIKKLDLKSLKQETLNEMSLIDFVLDEEKNMLYGLDHLGKLIKIDLVTGDFIKEFQLFNTFIFPFCSSKISKDGRFIIYGFNDDKVRVFDTELEEFIYESPKFSSKIIALSIDAENQLAYISLSENKLVVFDYHKKKKVQNFKYPIGQFYIQSIADNWINDLLFLASYDRITILNTKHRKVVRNLNRRVNRVMNFSYDPTGKYLAVATDKLNLKIWDLTLNKVIDSIPGFFPCQFMPDGQSILAMTSQLKIGQFDIESGKLINELDTDYEVIQSLTVSEDGKFIAAAGYQNIIKVWEVETGKRIADLKGHTGGVLSLDFHPTKPLLVSGSLDETSKVWNYVTQVLEQNFTDQSISIKAVKFSPNGEYLASASWGKDIKVRNTNNWETVYTLKGHENSINSIDFSYDNAFLISGAGNNSVGRADNSVICWSLKSGEVKCKFNSHKGEVIKVVSDPNSHRFFSASIDGAINYFDFQSCELVATYHGVGGNEFMIYTPDNYYFASRKATNAVGFRVGEKVVPFEQYDVFLNRPDIVASRIGKSHPQLIKAYYYLFKKRLRKLNLNEDEIELNYELPQLENETEYALVTDADSQVVWIKAWDNHSFIQSILVEVNGVPIYGRGGMKVDHQIKSFRKELTIPLVEGENRILISCRNSNGVESLYEQLDIYRTKTEKKHNLYIVSIGVSEYEDDRFNLKYPKKDATDVLTTFATSKNHFNHIYTKLLVDKEVDDSVFFDLASFFESCTHEDMVIVFLAGHGVLNADYDYFFATHKMDFDSPEKEGISYQMITGLMEKIKAYKKVLIMDTCHSGELDKDELEVGPAPEVESGTLKFRSSGAGVRIKEGIGTQSLAKLTEDLFADVRKGSGATIISSAGGAEYAMESDEWQGGLFTYVLLKRLQNAKSDRVYLSELREYMYREVSRISDGKQIPTAREENILRDYIIFGK